MKHSRLTFTKRRLLAVLTGLGIIPFGVSGFAQARTPLKADCFFRQDTAIGSYGVRVWEDPNTLGGESFVCVVHHLTAYPTTVRFADGYQSRRRFSGVDRPNSGFELYLERTLNIDPNRSVEGLGWHFVGFRIQNVFLSPESGYAADFLASGRVQISSRHGLVFFEGLRDFRKQGTGREGKRSRVQEHIVTSEDGIDLKGLGGWLLNPGASDALQIRVLDRATDKELMQALYEPNDILRLNAAVLRQSMRLETEYRRGICEANAKGAPCFMTTACCEVIGLSDEAWELRSLRQFRDDWLGHQPGGPEDIAAYYRAAPQIIALINAHPLAEKNWLSHYARHILPSALLVQFGFRGAARRRYSKMMRELLTAEKG